MLEAICFVGSQMTLDSCCDSRLPNRTRLLDSELPPSISISIFQTTRTSLLRTPHNNPLRLPCNLPPRSLDLRPHNPRNHPNPCSGLHALFLRRHRSLLRRALRDLAMDFCSRVFGSRTIQMACGGEFRVCGGCGDGVCGVGLAAEGPSGALGEGELWVFEVGEGMKVSW